ncbi:hypothetical protein KKH05_02450 [Patescibacteria group bacterium]|nr:hypothetical protein [Patescibacteria group bacterium]
MNYAKKYADFLKNFFAPEESIRMVVDCSNGAVGPVFKELSDVEGVEFILINDIPDGDFPAHGPDPLAEGATDQLAEAIIEHKADFGVVFDSDGDRAIFLDELGRAINSYSVFLCIKDFFKPPYVVNVNALADFTMPEAKVIEEKVGRFNIINTMREKSAELGVEHSGHYYFKEFSYSDSGILGVVFMVNYVAQIKKQGIAVSKIMGDLIKLEWPLETNYKVNDGEGVIMRVKEHYKNDPAYKIRELDGVSVFGPDFAFNVRASNTEPLLRLNIAAKNKKTFEDKLTEVKKVMGVDEASAS